MCEAIEFDGFTGVHVSWKRKADTTGDVDLHEFVLFYSCIQPYLDRSHNMILIGAQWGILIQLYGIYIIVNKSFDAKASDIGGGMVAVGVLIPIASLLGTKLRGSGKRDPEPNKGKVKKLNESVKDTEKKRELMAESDDVKIQWASSRCGKCAVEQLLLNHNAIQDYFSLPFLILPSLHLNRAASSS